MIHLLYQKGKFSLQNFTLFHITFRHLRPDASEYVKRYVDDDFDESSLSSVSSSSLRDLTNSYQLLFCRMSNGVLSV